MNKNNIIGIFALLLMVFGSACQNKNDKEETQMQAQTQTQGQQLNPNMQYRDLGTTGLKVSEISIGCGAFGKMDSTASKEFMKVALDSGINYIDIYDANPDVRGKIGYALQGRRDQMIIQGHIGSYWNGEKYERTRDVEKCKEGFNELLRLLGTDHIEVGMIHIADSPEEWEEIVNSPFLDYVKQLKAEGKIQHIGLSSHNAAVALTAVKTGLIEVLMFSLNPAFDRIPSDKSPWEAGDIDYNTAGIDPVRMELYDYCTQHKIAITVMKVFGGGGRLLDAKLSPLKKALTPVQCISYSLAKPCVATAICGASNIEELLSDLYYEHATDAEKDLTNLFSSTKSSTCNGQCTYCNHCSPCPVGIDIAEVNRLLDEALKHDHVPDNIMKEYKALPHKAGECVECGACEGRCPFGVPVKERMKKAAKVFGE